MHVYHHFAVMLNDKILCDSYHGFNNIIYLKTLMELKTILLIF